MLEVDAKFSWSGTDASVAGEYDEVAAGNLGHPLKVWGAERLRADIVTAERAPTGVPWPPWVDPDDTSFTARMRSAEVACLQYNSETANEIHRELSAANETMTPSKRAGVQGLASWMAHVEGDLVAAQNLALGEREWRITAAESQDLEGLLFWVVRIASIEFDLGNRRSTFEHIVNHLESALAYSDPDLLRMLAVSLAASIGKSHPRECARLIGAIKRYKLVEEIVRPKEEDEEVAEDWAPAQTLLSAGEWERA